MNQAVMMRIGACVVAVGFCLYSYIDKQNQLTRLRLDIPLLAKEVRDLQEENTRVRYEIELFESPEHLMQLARSNEYSHLKHPFSKDILTLNEAAPLPEAELSQEALAQAKAKPTQVLGSK